MPRTAGFVTFAALSLACAAMQPRAFMSRMPYHRGLSKSVGDDDPFPYETLYFNATLDHFDFTVHAPGGLTTFSQKYLMYKGYYTPGGPIFFYTGNEGPVELFCENAGFMWQVAQEFGALVVCAEHRYYGTTLPFGPNTYDSNVNLQWLTMEQALADYAILIDYLKQTVAGASSSPVVAFGGSYGGMLSSWFRIKYPSAVVGAIAASAPIWQFTGLASEYVYSNITTRTFASASEVCASTIASSWDTMTALSQTQAGLKLMTEQLQLCYPLQTQTDMSNLFNWINNAIQYMAMADYPYPASFLGPMPGNPVNVSCSYFTNPNPTNAEMLTSIKGLVDVFYNWTGENGACYNITTNGPSTLGDLGGWNYQSCTEMVMPIGQYGPPNDMLYLAPWNLSYQVAYCAQTYDVIARPYWIPVSFGGYNLQGASNIVFSNGNLDPWSGGGVTRNITGAPSIVAIVIEGGAHHLDLRKSEPEDPETVIVARNIHRLNIRTWLTEFYTAHPDSGYTVPE